MIGAKTSKQSIYNKKRTQKINEKKIALKEKRKLQKQKEKSKKKKSNNEEKMNLQNEKYLQNCINLLCIKYPI